MSTSVTMPALGESVTEGTVTRWLKQEGDEVAADEPLLEVSTDKVDTEIPSPAAGVLQRIVVGEDETVAVGAELAVIGDGQADGGEQPAQQADQQADQQQEPQEPAEQQQAEQQPEAQGGEQQQPQQAEQQEQQQEEQPPAEQNEEPAQQPASAPSDGGQSGDSGGGTSVTMPALGESVTEGTVTRWLKQEGDQVAADEPLLEVSTDKVDTEIPSPAAGILQRIVVGEDETVAVGAELAVIGGAGGGGGAPSKQAEQSADDEQQKEQQTEPAQQQQQPASPSLISAPAPTQAPAQQAPQPAAPFQQGPPPQQPAPQQAPAPQAPRHQAPAQPEGDGEGSAYVTPLVRKLAGEHGVDLSTLKGTGVGGRIRKQDVLEAATAARQQQAPATAQPAGTPSKAPDSGAPVISPLRGTTEKMSRLRKVIASRMVESLQVSAQLTTVVEVDLTRIARLRTRSKTAFEAREGVKLSFLPFLAKATIEALKVHPKLNSSIDMDKGEITYYDAEHLGVAVDTERGLLVPVVRDAGDLNIAGLARKIADLAERTRTNKITPDELGGGTFTITNTGSRGALFDTPIINQPQVAILGTGAVVKRPVVVDDPDLGETIAVRSMAYLALSYDHRIVDGADAARFLSTVKQRLEEGAFEADLAL
jgi:pyruvate dehydrogenase E2 component (dihydrolipoamide acetyltransferase)